MDIIRQYGRLTGIIAQAETGSIEIHLSTRPKSVRDAVELEQLLKDIAVVAGPLLRLAGLL
jgi:hypothetical protein